MTPDNRILFRNEACIVINKLPGESSEIPPEFPTESPPEVSPAISPEVPQAEAEGEKFPAAVHRLDMPVSGCLLLAKTQEATVFLGAAFANARVEKHYWAIVEMPRDANVLPSEGELVHWLSFDPKKNKSFAHDQYRHGRKKAVLRYRIAGRGERYLFLVIDLVTGRHHQIRAQLAAKGLHIKGDLKYGAARSEKNGGIRLHAYSLAFPNPLNPCETIRVTAPPPPGPYAFILSARSFVMSPSMTSSRSPSMNTGSLYSVSPILWSETRPCGKL